MGTMLCVALVIALSQPVDANETPLPIAGKRVVFLGDSITYSGGYLQWLETCLRLNDPEFDAELLNLGLASETVSGLSEPGHADGRFPRPDLHERMQRVLEATRPDLVVACYGMNCGIYHPFSDGRFARYQQGIRDLRVAAEGVGVQLLHLTPPVFDPVPIADRTLPAGLDEYSRPFVDYNEVLGRYSDWLLSQRAQGWHVVDIHNPLNTYLAQARSADPKFALSRDGVHPNSQGHALIARTLLTYWEVPTAVLDQGLESDPPFEKIPNGQQLFEIIGRRQRLLRDAWLTETRHTRPGVKPGLPLAEAQQQAQALHEQICELQSTVAQQQ